VRLTRFLGAAVLATGLGLVGAGPATACSSHHAVDPASGAYLSVVVCDTRTGGGGGGAVAPTQPGPSHIEPLLRSDDELGACISPVRRPGAADPHANDLGVLDAILSVVPPCAGADLGRVRPVSLASEAWIRTPLAPPKPTLSPAEPVTGRDAYLAVGTLLRPTFTHATPLGTLTITAIGQPTVAWGDGATTTAAVGDAGGPHPTGDIRHVYERRGPVHATVTVTWRATWSLAGEGGNLPALRTFAAFDTTVREIQAVVTG
jgi:hypothetical protein